MSNAKPLFDQPLSRRRVLHFMAGVPAFPVAAGSGTMLLTGCGSDSNDDVISTPAQSTVKAVSFSGMQAPTLDNPQDMATVYVNSKMTADMADGSQQIYDLQYKPFFKTGDMVADGNGGQTLAGGYYDINNNPIIDDSTGSPRQFFSDCPDGTSLLTVPGAKVAGVKGKPVFAVTQFEYTSINLAGESMYGQLPSPIAILTLDQDPSTGALELVKYQNVDTSFVNGLWITCGASLSPWGTHLSSEEYEPDAHAPNDRFRSFSNYLYGNETEANPYDYGHMPEVFVNPNGTGFIKKHYNLGRISHELVQVMPDERTVLMGDDWTNGGLFMFIADKPADLGAGGTLYVAKATQITAKGVGTGEFDLTWINLGSASSSDIQAMVNVVSPTDFMDVKFEDPNDQTYTKIRYAGNDNWVKLNDSFEQADKAAAFLETHRYAALQGGSMAFTKMEGTTVNVADKVAYSAMSAIRSSMVDGTTDVEVAKISAGAVYALNLRGNQVDTAGNAMNSDWVPVDMKAPAALVGEDLDNADALGNTANPDRIANPDNLKFSEKLRTLFIGEDSGAHTNNFLWAYNVDTKELKRILSTPAGAESTGLHAVDEVNGFTYIMSNFQHPGDGLADAIADNQNIRDDNADKSIEEIELMLNPLGRVGEKVEPFIKQNFSDGYAAQVGYIAFMPNDEMDV